MMYTLLWCHKFYFGAYSPHCFRTCERNTKITVLCLHKDHFVTTILSLQWKSLCLQRWSFYWNNPHLLWDLHHPPREVAEKEVGLVALHLSMLDGLVIEERIHLDCFICCCSILILGTPRVNRRYDYTGARVTLAPWLHWCYGYMSTMVTLVLWLHEHHGYNGAMVTRSPWLQWCYGYMGTMVTLVLWLHGHHGYNGDMVT